MDINVIPVNPSADEILGQKSYKRLTDVPGNVDIVDVFRPSEDVPNYVQDVIQKKPKVFWEQLKFTIQRQKKRSPQQGSRSSLIVACFKSIINSDTSLTLAEKFYNFLVTSRIENVLLPRPGSPRLSNTQFHVFKFHRFVRIRIQAEHLHRLERFPRVLVTQIKPVRVTVNFEKRFGLGWIFQLPCENQNCSRSAPSVIFQWDER